MYNNILFISHVICLYLVVWGAARIGRDMLYVCLILMPLCANMIVAKEVMLFGYEVSTADAYTMAFFFGMNTVHENYGQNEAWRLLFASILVAALVPLLLATHLWYEPSVHDKMHDVYAQSLGVLPRVAIFSCVSFALSQIMERVGFSYLSRVTSWPFIIRSLIVVMCSSLFDTWFFTYSALAPLLHDPWSMCVMSYGIKCVCMIIWACAAALQPSSRSIYDK